MGVRFVVQVIRAVAPILARIKGDMHSLLQGMAPPRPDALVSTLENSVCLVRDIICESHHKRAPHHRRKVLDL